METKDHQMKGKIYHNNDTRRQDPNLTANGSGVSGVERNAQTHS